MRIKEKTFGPNMVLHLSGSMLSETDTEELRGRIYRLATNSVKHVIVDLGEIQHINSSGIGSLISCLTTMRKAGGDIRLAGVNEHVGKIISITRLDVVLKIYAGVNEALSDCRGAASAEEFSR